MRIAYTVLEVDRHENASLIRQKLSFLDEMKTVVCDARKEYPDCIKKYPQYKHIFDSLTNKGYIGLWISNLNAFYSLLESDYDAILIFEDDAVLVDDFQSKFKKCLEEIPTDFGLFSIGYRDLYLNSYSEAHSIQKDNVCRMFQTGDSWGILYKKEFVQELLDRIVGHKILYGLPDTAIMSYALGNVKPFTNYKPYSTTPSLGSLIFHNNDKSVSSIDSSI